MVDLGVGSCELAEPLGRHWFRAKGKDRAMVHHSQAETLGVSLIQ